MQLCKNAYNTGDIDFRLVETTCGNLYMHRLLREPAGHLTIEEFHPGEDVTWPFWHHEVHVVIRGTAELEVSSPPALRNRDRFSTAAGDAYMIHRGDLIRFKVTSDEPYRHLCVIMPAIPIPSGDQLIAERYEALERY
jgi:hypothetical protein